MTTATLVQGEKAKAAAPVWETDREHPGDTVSRRMRVVGADGETETARYHFPTGEWCWREGRWPVVSWRDVGEANPKQ